MGRGRGRTRITGQDAGRIGGESVRYGTVKVAIAVLVAAAAAVAVVAAAVVGTVVFRRDAGAGPDPFAGAYPLITPAPTPSPKATWQPTGRPAGPLPTFHGQPSRVAGRIVDRKAGVSYARFAPPWHLIAGMGHSAGQEIKSKKIDYEHSWYVGVYSDPLDPEFDLPGPNHLRAAAELTAGDFLHLLYEDGTRKEIAGAPMTIDHRPAWVTAVKGTHPAGTKRVLTSQTEVVVAIDVGGRIATVEIQVPNNKERLLPDVNTVVRSIRVLR